MTKTKEEIIKKGLCKTCDPHICHNNYDLCPYQYNLDVQLCLTCKYRDFTIVEGHPKCYFSCPYRKDKQNSLKKWL